MLFNFINVPPSMIVILITSLVTVVHCLEIKSNKEMNDDVNTIFGKYLKKIPDIESRYVLNDKLSSVINHYFKGKISALPLFKINLKIDRNPMKVPWTLNTVEKQKGDIVWRGDESAEQQDKNDKPVKTYTVVKESPHSQAVKHYSTIIPTSSEVAPPK